MKQVKPTRMILKRLYRDYIREHRGRFLLAIACMIVAAAATAANAWMMQPMLDDVFLRRDESKLVIIPLLVFAITTIGGIASYGQAVMIRYAGQKIVADMQIDLFSHLMRADLALFHDQASGRMISRFTNDIQMLRMAISMVCVGFARESVSLVFLIGVMVWQSPILALIALTVFPLAVYPVIRLGKRMRKVADQTQAELGHFTARLDETFENAPVVKAYGREEWEVSRARTHIQKLFKLYVKAATLQAAASPMMEIFSGMAIAGVIWYGGHAVLEGHTTPGAFFSFITAMVMAYKPAKMLTGLHTNLQEGMASASRLFDALDVNPAIADGAGATALQASRGEVRLEQLSFSYKDEMQVLKQVSIHVPAGKTVALVGPSGAGKSTIMNLLLRFYEPQSGRILIDGQDIKQVTLASLRDSMALVSQHTLLFDDTIRENIRYGSAHATEEDIIQAAKGSEAEEFILRMPQGYDTLIGQNGVRLSGGQRQRLAIARAMLKNAPILLLDEATSSLDTVSERKVQEALDRLKQGRTTLVIAHRLATVIHADLICVIEHGEVAETGTHAELLAKKGSYYRLYSRQFESGQEVFA